MPKHNRKIKFNWNKKLSTTYTVVGVCSCNSLATRWGTRNLIFIVVSIHLWPLLHRCSLIAVCLVQQARLWPSINGCSHSKKTVWPESTRLTSPEVWASIGDFKGLTRFRQSLLFSSSLKKTKGDSAISIAVADPGKCPLFLDQTEARRADKRFWGDCPPRYLRVWMTAPPPVSQGLDPALNFELTCN